MAVRLNAGETDKIQGTSSSRPFLAKVFVIYIVLGVFLTSCTQVTPTVVSTVTPEIVTPTSLPQITRTPYPTRPVYAPATLVDYNVQPGDSVEVLAAHFNTTAAEIYDANPLIDKKATTLAAGQAIKIPIYYKALWGSQFKILPDNLFVNGPSQIGFDTVAFVDSQPGWLKYYSVLAGDKTRRGGDLIDYVAQNASISPRVLLALAEYQAGALSQPVLSEDLATYPLGYAEQFHQGFYLQLVWAANLLNNGYYGWRNGRLDSFTLADGDMEVPDPWQNAGTVALQYYYSKLYGRKIYDQAIHDDGFFSVYQSYFGNPWDNASVNIPGNLTQPDLVLPFVVGKKWAFTGGPHTSWGTGEPLAAIDFAPPTAAGGCINSLDYVVAMADGQVVRSEPAVVMLDLDKDGDERTGWVIFYLHLGTNEMVRPGVIVKQGDPIGHPSCEGGSATGTHVHIARKYNGEWIDADSAIPFNLEGWIAHNGSQPYQGTLRRYGKVVTASDKGLSNSVIVAGQK
jgi:murein DD-endopeptidase MepM/ murein hydrolase activator NlpD